MTRAKINKNSQKTVLITGATSGIGKEITLRYAEKGWSIVGHYCSSEDKAKELKKIVDAYNVKCWLLKSNFSSKREIIRFINNVKKFRIDSLVNNAGTYVAKKHFSKLTIEDIAGVFMVNTFAPMVLTSRIFMDMKKRRFGRIVNISSIAAKYGGSGYSLHYGCSKRGLEGLTGTLAREGAEYDVLVNTIRPGVIDTEFHKKFPKDMRKRTAMIPLKKMGMPKDIADMVYYLGSDVNKFITNEIITIAGGE